MPEIIEKGKKTKIERYDGDVPTNFEQTKATKLERYGNEFFSNRPKAEKTMFENLGYKHAMQSPLVREKQQQKMIDNHGVPFASQNAEIYLNTLKSAFKVKQYKETDIYYQGSYELFFLEEMEKLSLINEVKRGKSYNYIFEDSNHVYHCDFEFSGKQIEIKSNWTYNKNGKDKKLEEKNKAKWQSVRDNNEDIIILIGKEKITNFISSLKNS